VLQLRSRGPGSTFLRTAGAHDPAYLLVSELRGQT